MHLLTLEHLCTWKGLGGCNHGSGAGKTSPLFQKESYDLKLFLKSCLKDNWDKGLLPLLGFGVNLPVTEELVLDDTN